MKIPIVIGEYNHYGYTLFIANSIREIYTATNHRQDSGQTVSIGDPDCLPLRKIRQFCIKTGKEIAQEERWKWGEVIRVDDNSLLVDNWI